MSQFDEVLPPDIMDQIHSSISALIRRRAALRVRIEELEAEGCIHGNIVDEFRNVINGKGRPNGPYYRLTFYTDPVTGIKPKPKYLGKNMERVRKVQRQIDNYAVRQDYLSQLEEIDRILAYTRRQVENLNSYLNFQTKDYEQLVIPALDIGSSGVAKQEG